MAQLSRTYRWILASCCLWCASYVVFRGTQLMGGRRASAPKMFAQPIFRPVEVVRDGLVTDDGPIAAAIRDDALPLMAKGPGRPLQVDKGAHDAYGDALDSRFAIPTPAANRRSLSTRVPTRAPSLGTPGRTSVPTPPATPAPSPAHQQTIAPTTATKRANHTNLTTLGRNVTNTTTWDHVNLPPPTHLMADTRMQASVVAAMQWAWKGYRAQAFGLDVQTMSSQSLVGGHDVALTLVESLDTLYLMGLLDEFDEAAEWTEAHLTTIMAKLGDMDIIDDTPSRVLGGLMAAYQLSGRPGLLSVAGEFGERLAQSWNQTTNHGRVRSLTCLVDGLRQGLSSNMCLAEVAAIQLDLTYLARLTGRRQYAALADAAMDKVARLVQTTDPNILFSMEDDANPLTSFGSTRNCCGTRFANQLLQQWLFSGKQDTRKMYMAAVESINRTWVGRTAQFNWSFFGELDDQRQLTAGMEHAACSLPGMLAQGYINGMPSWHLELGTDLLRTCFDMNNQLPNGLAPQIGHLNDTITMSEDVAMPVRPRDAVNVLHPETIESLMILYRATGNETYRAWGKVIFDAIELHFNLDEGGASSVNYLDMATPTNGVQPEMESFFMADSLKFYYLLFSDETVVSLDQFVLASGAHPFWILADYPVQETEDITFPPALYDRDHRLERGDSVNASQGP
ncbi:Aste57867_20595 [Aphanomyces stellatus]|uniref:alpha-1,2-Mannosidase n=1 Tax=Aphanomyces stellatus TaxID=120398 RepID=A0A485LG02_9STRA|nr:hypothetical protein As57867_020528 [Aphanomyces stellatus]VFT97275.1 Aste57867_20595 [Aphanomyces stellatus]